MEEAPIEVVDLGDGSTPSPDSSTKVASKPPTTLVVVAAVLAAVVVGAVAFWPTPDGPADITATLAVGDGRREVIPTGPSDAPSLVWVDSSADGCRHVLAAATVGDVVVVATFGDSLDADSDPSGFVAVARSIDDGEQRWAVDLESGFAERFEVMGDDRVLLVSSTSMRLVSSVDGSELARRSIAPRSVVATTADRIVLRRGTELVVLDEQFEERFRYTIEPRATVDVAGTDIVTVDRGTVTVLDLAGGAVRWAFKASADAIAVLDDVVVAQSDTALIGLDRNDGATLWEGRADQTIMAIGADRFAAVPMRRGEVVVFGSDGQEQWRAEVATNFVLGTTGAAPVVLTLGEDGGSIRDSATGAVVQDVTYDEVSGVSASDLLVADDAGIRLVELATGAERLRFATEGEPCSLRVVNGGVLVSTAEALLFYA